MSLTTLSDLKAHLGITGTSQNALLTQIIRGCSGAIRDYCKGTEFGGLITGNTAASPTVITAPGHGLSTGDAIVIAGSNSTPTIDGARSVTRIDADTFSIPVDCSAGTAGTAGYYYRTFTEYLSGDNTRWLPLKRKPVRSLTSVYLDDTGYWGQGSNAFSADTLLTAGTDYALKLDDGAVSQSGLVLRIGGVWPRPAGLLAGQLTPVNGQSTGNIKVTYACGYAPLPDQYQLAMHQYCAIVMRLRKTGADIQSETFDYYTYNLSPAADQDKAFGGVRQLLGSARKWVW